MKNSPLTKEIIHKILTDVNIYDNKLVGIIDQDLLLPEEEYIKAEYSDISADMVPKNPLNYIQYNSASKKIFVKYPIHVGVAKCDDFEIKVLFCNLSLEIKEYCLLFQSNKSNVYGLYLSEDGSSIFSVLTSKSWISTSIASQANLLIGFENLASLGLSWKPLQEYSKLLEDANDFIRTFDLV